MRFPVAIPVAIMLLTLIYSTVRDISGFNRRMAEIADQEQPAEAILKKTRRQAEFVDGLRVSLQKLAPTDPVAARIMQEYFPPQSPANQPDPASTPAR
jgi:hypothetical protein